MKTSSGSAFTYYVYDDLNRLRYTIPPIQVDLMTSGGTYTYDMLKDYCFYTEYDKYGRVIKQKNPGSEHILYIYDKRGRLVMSQDGNQRTQNKWGVTKFDTADRAIMTAFITGGTEQEHRNAFESQTLFGESMTSGNNIHFYTNNCYPIIASQNDVMTVTYYDRYEWIDRLYDFEEYQFSIANSLGERIQMQNTGENIIETVLDCITGTKTKVVGSETNQWLYSAVYYNKDYQTIQTISDVYPLGREIVSNKYNHSGKVVQAKVMQVYEDKTYEYNKWFNYDIQGRLLSLSQQITGDPSGKVTIASYLYDDIGKLKSKILHNNLDSTNYRYDISGNVLAASSPNFSYAIGMDLYNIDESSIRHDGLIASTTWSYDRTGRQSGYKHTYDDKGQLSASTFMQYSNRSWKVGNKFDEKNITYDKNGNMKTLLRTDANGNPLHDISYGYSPNSNQLKSMIINQSPTVSDFTYDANGNMIADLATATSIEYNELNLPKKITTPLSEVSYVYDATGTRLAMNEGNSATFYRDVMVYAKSGTNPEEMLYIIHSDGLIVKESNAWTYKYFKKDHIGNTRVLLAARKQYGRTNLIAEQTTDFYPYGTAFELNNLDKNKYLVTGKELQDINFASGGINGVYDFHARFYNSFNGRWFSPDPANQLANPYLYCGNNPVMYVDPDGEFFFSAMAIGAVISGTVGYFSGKAAGLSGLNLISYAFMNAVIGGVSGGVGASVGTNVASSLSIGGFTGGFVAGAAGGAVAGSISGTFSTALNNATFGTNNNILLGGLKGGLIGGVAGGLISGAATGIDAVNSGASFWNGAVDEVGGSSIGTFLDEEIAAGAKPTKTGEIAKTSTNPDYGKYGMTRNSGTKAHRGVDYAGKVGDDIYAMYDGQVTQIGGSKAYGEHFVRTSSSISGKMYNVDYGHMSSHSVSANQSVLAGGVVGQMGRLGNLANTSFPTHVHIAVWRPISGGLMGFVMPMWK